MSFTLDEHSCDFRAPSLYKKSIQIFQLTSFQFQVNITHTRKSAQSLVSVLQPYGNVVTICGAFVVK